MKGMSCLNFSEKLIKLRKEKGFSQEELGNKLNVARQTVSKWELGETTPEMDKLIKMSEIFDITLDELIKGEKEEETISGDNSNTNTQKLAGLVIKILKGLGVFLIVLLIVSILLAIMGSAAFNRVGEDGSGVNSTVIEVQENEEVEFEG